MSIAEIHRIMDLDSAGMDAINILVSHLEDAQTNSDDSGNIRLTGLGEHVLPFWSILGVDPTVRPRYVCMGCPSALTFF